MAGTTTAHEDEGASPKELLLEAARRNNVDLLEEVLGNKKVDADFLNHSTDGVGNTALHMAAQHGSLEVLDHLLDQEGLEVDPINRMEQETPLHKAVQYANKEKEHGVDVVEMLIDAGADPRIRNKQKQRPIDIVDPRDTKLREILQRAEYAMTVGNDVVDDDDNDGPASDSD
ncbi:ankyrin repeat protein-like protein [Morchella conica CCBAS932]|uniref:Ankyrin repeat protein-like protein n=1 Tax=Morchella conica CCBAS932 TaxID=1392247 RepID=A0A3N4L0Z1_9PEZI|nr:ankyrin repeat protein-like protein [Morchella conica CCBAS932]